MFYNGAGKFQIPVINIHVLTMNYKKFFVSKK